MLSAHTPALNFSKSRQQIYSRRHFQYQWLDLATKNLPSIANITWATTTQNMWYVSTLFYNLSQKCPAKKCVRKSTVKFQNGVKNRCDPAKKKWKCDQKTVCLPPLLSDTLFFFWVKSHLSRQRKIPFVWYVRLCDLHLRFIFVKLWNAFIVC